MKNIYLYVIFLSAIFSFSSLYAEGKLNILDYYNAIPQKLLSINKFMIVAKKYENGDKAWGIRDPAYGHAFFPMVVDFKNGFIELYFAGAGYSRQQIVLFIAKSGKKYIGLSYEGSYLFGISRATLRFYRIADFRWLYGIADFRWIDVSSKILPVIPYRKFLKSEKMVGKVKKVKQILEPLPLFSYTLLRKGVVMKIKLLVGNLNILIRQKEKRIIDRKVIKISTKDLSVLTDFVKQIKKSEIKLKWNRNKGVFLVL